MSSNTEKRIESLRFLVIEDNAFTSLVVTQTLKSLGAKDIRTAKTGREALDLIAGMTLPPDVLLLDLRMPEMGGMEMISRLADRAYPGYVIITSGVDEETLSSVEEVANETSVNILGCLLKPLESAALAELLERLPDL